VNEKMTIRFFNLSPGNNSVLRLYNITGELVSTIHLKTSEAQIDLSGFSNGVYMAQLISGENSVSRKFVVSHR